MTRVVAISGGIGSGKTEISRRVAERLKLARVSFGDWIRAEATRRGQNHSRGALQEVGETVIAELGMTAFCRAVLDSVDWSGRGLVIDGLRHLEAVEATRAALAPVPLALVFLDADADTRRARSDARARAGDAVNEEHSTEREVPELKSIADLVLDARLSEDDLVDTVVSALGGDQAVTGPGGDAGDEPARPQES